ncbi:DUF3889 domain-containing protein [Sporosarcina aquimarina]|uniref:DUF3889 domain-containing protein n=1 Tax=Sporosarcina aquimarina TaxID=114975 RepID=A0ABU4G2J7_9BACL|nr:DUF3889 domain-containing protein [Sporosarcina aquimarina]MDW0111200.1 DUF3889 domain-containing protein [Sporosarcina aquimarina]
MLIKIGIAVGLFILNYSPQAPVADVVQADAPAYAKWSRLAIKQTQTTYPKASIIDYLYMGSAQNDGSTVATFRLWLREGKREYAVVVRVTYATETEKLESVKFHEIIPPRNS